MERPDEKLFIQHSEHFQKIDDLLEKFCLNNDFEFEKNTYRSPCRILRKKGNPTLIFDFYQEGSWKELTYSDKLPHTFGICGFYEPTPDSKIKFKLEKVFAENKKFEEIVLQLPNYLSKGLKILKSWTPEQFEIEGRAVENYKNM